MMKTIFPFLLPGLLATATLVNGAVLTGIPVGTMIHANIGYSASEQRLYAHVDIPTPALAPLDVTNPTDNFDPSAGWFTYLDPSQKGMAFSRQYGLVMDASSDPIPAEMRISFRLISRSDGLDLFTYRASGIWDPILGTEGSTNRLDWDLRMVHPGIAAPPGTNAHSAVLEAFAVDTSTGAALTGIAPAQFTLEWSNTPSIRVLRISSDAAVCWSARATNYVLENTSELSPANWTAVGGTPQVIGGECRMPMDQLNSKAFYRLRRVP